MGILHIIIAFTSEGEGDKRVVNHITFNRICFKRILKLMDLFRDIGQSSSSVKICQLLLLLVKIYNAHLDLMRFNNFISSFQYPFPSCFCLISLLLSFLN